MQIVKCLLFMAIWVHMSLYHSLLPFQLVTIHQMVTPWVPFPQL